MAKQQIGYNSRSGALFIFFGRHRDSLKVLFFDGSGIAISTSPRPRRFPDSGAATKTARHVELDDATLEALLDDVDVTETAKVPPRPKTH